MTEQEKLMYSVLKRLSIANAPFVFKGGLITNLVLEENGGVTLKRATVDIDANWVDRPPSMEYLILTIKNSLGELNEIYDVVSFREYGENRSAGINFIDKATGNKAFSMDIEVKPVKANRDYFLGDVKVKGILPDEILADKICAVSTDTVYKHRTKDLVDIYALSSCVITSTTSILTACEDRGKTIKDFDGFLHKKELIEHAYDKLKRIDNKPEFSKLYDTTKSFLTPFIERKTNNLIWQPDCVSWKESEKEMHREKPNIKVTRKSKKRKGCEIDDD